jgi:hypothetical protein
MTHLTGARFMASSPEEGYTEAIAGARLDDRADGRTGGAGLASV